MKVLWLSPTPSLGENYLNNKPVNGGWIKSLERAIRDQVELSILFYHYEEAKPFSFGGTNYFPVNRYKKGRISKIMTRVFNGLESKKDIDQFLSIINEVQPDIIHIHGTEGPFGMIQKWTNIPCVVSVQGSISVILYRYFSGISYTRAIRFSKVKDWLFFRTSIHGYYQFVKMAKREKAIFQQTNYIIGRTTWDRRISKVLAPTAQYFHNDEILRDSFYTTVWENDLRGKLRLFTTAGPGIYKGLETILFCAQLLDQNGVDFQWDIAGLQETDELVVVATKVVGQGTFPQVNYAGILKEQVLVQKLLQAHLYISPSHIENSPNSLCEAMILGMPCIATNAGGTASLLEDGKEGVLIQDGDPYVMAGTIMELAEDFSRARRLGERARKRARQRHDPQVIVAELLAIYNRVAQENLLAPSLSFENKKTV